MSQARTFDPNIPVLTELFQDEAAPQEAETALPAAASLEANAAADDEREADLETRAIDSWSETEWQALERRLAERVLQQLQGRIDFVLEQRLRDSMEEVLQKTMADLSADIRHGLQQTISSIVTRAVSQELAHLQALKS